MQLHIFTLVFLRIPCNKFLTPSAFVLFIVKHVYLKDWEGIMKNFEEFDERYLKLMKNKCATIDNPYWVLEIEPKEFFIT
jgi:hypothetical protein